MSSWLKRAWPYIGVVFGLVVLASPVIADLIETWRSSQTISQVTTKVSQIPSDQKERLLAQAHAYNEGLAEHTTSPDVLPYEQQLSWDGSQALCYIEIPRIDVHLRVYHGTGDDELMAGAGHIEGTSLPVGGSSTHCVISAHSGMPTARMFDDLHDLEPGDMFIIRTLDDSFAYRVTSSEEVTPDDTSSLHIAAGKDLCTLVTCTPYGVNSMRLLVHAERCDYEEAAEEEPPIIYFSPRIWALVAGLVLSGGALFITSLRVVRARRRKGAK